MQNFNPTVIYPDVYHHEAYMSQIPSYYPDTAYLYPNNEAIPLPYDTESFVPLAFNNTLDYLQHQMKIPAYCVSLANYYYSVAYPQCPLEFDLMLTCLVIAFKCHNDNLIKNVHVEEFIGYNTQALNSLEAHVLQILNYKLVVPSHVLKSFENDFTL